MGRIKNTFVFILLFISFCYCEISFEKKEKLLNGFIDYYNNLPDQLYTCEEGILYNAQQTDTDCYKIEVNLKVSDPHNLDSIKYVKCIGTVQDLHENGVTILNNDQCEDIKSPNKNGDNIEEAVAAVVSEISEPPFQRTPVQLANEVQPSTDAASGEQFIAVPREKPKILCVGCSSHINPQAEGVGELAALGVRQLNIDEPNVRHTLNSVIEVERQAQVVNGIRYILTLLVDYNSCTETQTESCVSTNTCKVSILEKPWQKFHDGSKYRAILSNNCTKEWIYGDDGVVLPPLPTNGENNENDFNSSNSPGDNPKSSNDPGSDIIKAVHNFDIQSQPNQQRILTDEDIKNLEEQIIPNSQFLQPSTENSESYSAVTVLPDMSIVSKQNAKVEVSNAKVERGDEAIPMQSEKEIPSSITEDKKKAIDDMLNFLNFAGFDTKDEHGENTPRMKRSYEHDLKIMSLTEKYNKIKKNIDNAKYVYNLAQTMVDYLNEMDMEVKNRVLKDVVNAEEEFENYQHFFYIQARVIIPCEKAECDDKDTKSKICNAVIDTSNKKNLQILTTFCYDDDLKKKTLGKVNSVPVDDPVLLNLVKNALNKIESESSVENAIKIYKIIDANTQKVSGTLTKTSLILNYLDCKKTVPLAMRTNCSVLEKLGSNICEVIIHERHWLKERKITYSCTKRPIDGSFSNIKHLKNDSANNPTVIDMLQEALQYLEVQSSRNNKQQIVKVNSVSTQLIAGFLTDIEFVVGYTTCTDNVDVIKSTCKLLENEPLRICKAQIWDRTWIKDGRQVDVSCKDPIKGVDSNYINKSRKKTLLSFVGGETPKNVNDPKFKSLAEESLQKFLKTSDDHQHYSVVTIKQVTVQVISGLKTRIKFEISPTNCLVDIAGQPTSYDCEILNAAEVISCFSEVWEQPWLQKKEIKVNCQTNNRRKREMLAGGLVEQDPNEPIFKALAEESMQQYLKDTGNSRPHKIIEVIKVTTQVFAGTSTKIDFTISPTDHESADVISCHSEIWEQSWLQKKEIKVNCQTNNRRKREMLAGGLVEQDPNEPIFKALAEESMQQYLKDTGNSRPHKIIEVIKVTTQVFAGTSTKIDFTISPTDHESADVISCHSEIWEQSWVQKKDIEVNCEIENQTYKNNNHIDRSIGDYRRKRSVGIRQRLGGQQEQDPTKSEYLILAKDSLKKYTRLYKNGMHHDVVEVVKVVTQVVSGIKYKIDFTAAPTKCSTCPLLECHADIWNQPWLKRKEIEIACHEHKNKKRRSLAFGAGEMRDVSNELYVDQKEDDRGKRQTGDDVDEDIVYYYADRAIKHFNEVSDTNNLHKLVSIHSAQSSMQMDTLMIRVYMEVVSTYCLRHADEADLENCEEMDGMKHKLCLARLWPSSDDELIIDQVSVVCDDNENFEIITGLSLPTFIRASINELEKSPKIKNKLVHLGEPRLIPSLDTNVPMKMNFLVATTNCTKDIDLDKNRFQCFVDTSMTTKSCLSLIWMSPNSRTIFKIKTDCTSTNRQKRSLDLSNATADDVLIQKLVQESLEKLEMSSLHRYKQRVLQINSYSSKITSGKVTTIDFDVGYTSCLKYEWVENITRCEFLEHLPRRHCVSQIYERLWLNNGRNIEVNCEDDETPLEAHVEFESAESAKKLANEALKHIEAKYPHPRKQKVVRIFSLEKQVVAGIHYRMKIEVGLTDCTALSTQTDCKLLKGLENSKFCRVNVWIRPWTNHPPNFRVTCDYQEGAAADLYHRLQAEYLFSEFLATYKPDYINDHTEMLKRFGIFEANIRKIHELNTHERGTARYAVTRFADLSYEEFSSKYLGLKPSLRDYNQVPIRNATIPKIDIPDKFDWRDHGAVTDVKDQGSCGSCWAFSVTGNIEGQWKIESGELVSLSEQELVDCDKLDNGCSGGLPDNAYRAIEQLGGLEAENDYPYDGEDDKCVFNKTLSKVQISGAVNISSNETDMAKWLVKHGPISIGINANAMQFYVGGVSHPWKMLCNPTNLDHGVLIVGYGTKDYPLFHKKLPYWIVKNSWGKTWGEQGYYRVYRGDGTCGVNQMASSAVI